MAKKTLSLDLRPQTFRQMFGQASVCRAVTKQMVDRPPTAWMFCGETGSGKTTIARIVALSLQCAHKKFGYPCLECRKRQREFCIEEVNTGEHNTVDDIKDIVATSVYSPIGKSRYRVFILDEAQRISTQAQTILLKYFEDAPASTVWIICTTEPEKILASLRGRCIIHQMRSLKGRTAEEFIAWAYKKSGATGADISAFTEIVHTYSVTSPRNILMALEKVIAGIDPDKAVASLYSDVDTRRVCQALVKGNWGAIRSELSEASPSDAKLIRASIIGYLCTILLDPRPRLQPEVLAQLILDLSNTTGYDDNILLAQLSAKLWVASKLF